MEINIDTLKNCTFGLIDFAKVLEAQDAIAETLRRAMEEELKEVRSRYSDVLKESAADGQKLKEIVEAFEKEVKAVKTKYRKLFKALI